MGLRICALASLMLVGFGCVTERLVLESKYFLKDRNYAFAIYNQENRLLTHPFKGLQAQIDDRKYQALANNNQATSQNNSKRIGYPITDVYVVAHGWNFTIQEGISSFNEYMESLEKELGSFKGKNFQPFFILVAWPSATRPLTNLAKATLPFGLDDLLIPLSVPVDGGLFFLPTVWKQSINATKIALGSKYPNDYIFEDPQRTGFGSVQANLTEVGRDLPLSVLLFQLIQLKYDQDVNPPSFNIHVVGHSYGAKMSMLASMEALRRWVIHEKYGEKIIKLWHDEGVCSNATRDSNAYAKILEGVKTLEGDDKYVLSEASDLTPQSLKVYCGNLKEKREALREKVGTGFERDGKESPVVKKLWEFILGEYAQEGKLPPRPLESLVLFNPAMHPRELDYLIDASGFTAFAACGEEIGMLFFQNDECNHWLLRLIERKAIIFSNTDYANSWPFSVTQGLMNNSYTQKTETWMENQLQKIKENMGLEKDRYYLRYPLDFVFNVSFGTAGLVAGVGGGIGSWGKGHVDTFTSVLGDGTLLGLLNPASWSFPKIGAANELGLLFRPSMPALGRAGMRGLTKGKGKQTHDLKGLKPFYHRDQSNIEPRGVCYASYERRKIDAPLFFTIHRKFFYSFDASQIFDSTWPPLIGSHGDLRTLTPVPCHDSNVEPPYIWQQLGKEMEYESLHGLMLEGIEGTVAHISFNDDWGFLREVLDQMKVVEGEQVSNEQKKLEQALLKGFSKLYSNSSEVTQPDTIRFWRTTEKPLSEKWEKIIRPTVWSEVGRWDSAKTGWLNHARRDELPKWFKGVSVERVIGPTAYLEIPHEGDYDRVFRSSITDLDLFVKRLFMTRPWEKGLRHITIEEWKQAGMDENGLDIVKARHAEDWVTAKFPYSMRELVEDYASWKLQENDVKRKEPSPQENLLRVQLEEEWEKIITSEELPKWLSGVSVERVIGATAADLDLFVERFLMTTPWGKGLRHITLEEWKQAGMDEKGLEIVQARHIADRVTARFSDFTRELLVAYCDDDKKKHQKKNCAEPEEDLRQESLLRDQLVLELEEIIRGDPLVELEPMQKMALFSAYKNGHFQRDTSEKAENDGNASGQTPEDRGPWNLASLDDLQHTQLLNRLLLAQVYADVLRLNQSFIEEWQKTGMDNYGLEIVKSMQTKEGLRDHITRVCLLEGKKKKPKRSYTFNFVYNFTKNECAPKHTRCKDIVSILDSAHIPCWRLRKTKGDNGQEVLTKL